MNDLHFIFYEAKRMFLDTSDMSCETERAHRRLCDYIWFSDRPPLNQNESLRQITHTDAAKWGKVKGELVEKGWLERDKFLLHRGVIETLNESKRKYVENFNRTAKANRQKLLQLNPPHPITGIVTIMDTNEGCHASVTSNVTLSVTDGVTHPVTSHVTMPVTPDVTLPQSESQRESQSEGSPIPIKPPISNGKGVVGGGTATRPPQAGHPKAAMLTEPAVMRLCAGIANNQPEWHYDNCKVPLDAARPPASLKPHLLPFVGQVTEAVALECWREAVRRTHEEIQNGTEVKRVGAYCAGIWKNLMTERAGKG